MIDVEEAKTVCKRGKAFIFETTKIKLGKPVRKYTHNIEPVWDGVPILATPNSVKCDIYLFIYLEHLLYLWVVVDDH